MRNVLRRRCLNVAICTLISVIILNSFSKALAVSVKPVDLLLLDSEKTEASDRPVHYYMKLGELTTGYALIRNKSNKPASVKIYSADGMNAQNGGVTLRQEGEMSELGSWVKLDAYTINLSPKGERWVKYKLKIPDFCEIGEHVGGILIQRVNPVKNKFGNFIVNEIDRAAIFITEHVMGKVNEIMKIMGFRNKLVNEKELFNFTLKNDGNIRCNVDSEIRIKNVITRDEAAKIKFERATILPRDFSPYAIVWNATPKYGYFSALLRIAYGKGQVETKEIKFFIIPFIVYLILALLILLALIAGAIFWYKKRRNIRSGIADRDR